MGLPSGSGGVAEFSIFTVVDTASLLYAFRELRVKHEELEQSTGAALLLLAAAASGKDDSQVADVSSGRAGED